MEIITLLGGALIPIINVGAFMPETWLRLTSAGLASIIVIANGISKLYKFQENWLNYRGLAEVLKREKEFYTHEVGDYAKRGDQARQKIFVERVEDLLAGTTVAYLALHKTEREALQPGTATAALPGAGNPPAERLD